MPLNPNLVKHGLDDEFYETACPTIGTLMLARFSTPERHNPVIYGADGLFFATYPTQRTYIRPALRNEFDIFTSEAEFQARPMLWVLVTQTSPGHHMILPVWRGHAFWNGPDVATDQGVAEVFLQMCLRQGLNLSEWYGYVSDQRVRKSDKARKLRVN
ncbi:hypothetical protein [Acidicapsa acidisoli]|uniref:hypothetical protein n=1 Tax=Acidicapsa acidisoli TaxID=1615681 RepID=UPI0021DFA56D|nr:hypothetical protein [Acidicapsa acidisoli]